MKRINKIELYALNNRELVDYFAKVLDILHASIQNELYILNAFEESYNSFASQLEEEDVRNKISLIALDNRVDRAWRAINIQLRANEMQHVEEIIEAGRKVSAVFNKTFDPTRLPYDDEQEALRKLIEELRKISPEILEKARVANLIDHLDALCGAFIEASNLTKELRIIDELKDNRYALIDVWNLLVSTIELKGEMHEIKDAEDIIDKINQLSSED